MKQKLTVTTDVGTFTRTTARPYLFVVVVALSAPQTWRKDAPGTFNAMTWSSRLDLAQREVRTWLPRFADEQPEMRIYSVVTGERVA